MNRLKFLVLTTFSLIIFFLGDLALTFTYKKINTYLSEDKNRMTNHNIYHHELKKNYNGLGRNTPGIKTKIINTNSFGLKSLPNKNIDFSDYNNNYIFMGDSFTEGSSVIYEESFVGIFEKNSKKTVANLGVVSYAPLIYLSKLNYLLEKDMNLNTL